MSESSTAAKPECTIEDSSHQNEMWEVPPHLNPASEPWFPMDVEIDWSSYNIPSSAFNPNLVFPQDFSAFQPYLPPVNYYPELEAHDEPTATRHASDDAGLKSLEGIVTDMFQVKSELEAKVQQLTKNVEEANETMKALRMDVDATEKWCEQLRTFIEDNFANFPTELRRSAQEMDVPICERQETGS